jgi:hypothetical protein
MDNALKQRAVVVGHLVLTAPAIAVVLLGPFFGLRMFGPFLFLYYLMAGIALGWQWYRVALPGWKKWLTGQGAQQKEVDVLADQSGLAWPIDAAIGSFALHASAPAICAIYLGPWLFSRWYVWIMPLLGISHTATGNLWLEHFELISIVPGLAVGYILARHFGKFAQYAWILPTIILAYKLLMFTEPQASVFAPHPSMRWEYFFVIQRTMPTFAPGFGGVDPIRVAEQMDFIGPFYAGLAYSAGALAEKHDLLKRFFGNSGMRSETETVQTEHIEDRAVNAPEDAARESD